MRSVSLLRLPSTLISCRAMHVLLDGIVPVLSVSNALVLLDLRHTSTVLLEALQLHALLALGLSLGTTVG